MSGPITTGLVSVIVPVFNRPSLVRSAVGSALAQTYPHVEVIVVDDGSTDQTPRVLEALCRQRPESVRTLRIPNGGPGVAREAGRQDARGEFIQYLDSDDLMHSSKLSRQVALLEDNPDCQFSLCATERIDAHGNIMGSERVERPNKGKLFPSLLNTRWWCTSAPLYRRALLTLAGPWPREWLFEDWQYEAQIGSVGASYYYVAEPLIGFRQHDDDRLQNSAKVNETHARYFGLALEKVYKCAKRAGVRSSDPEMLRFVHTLLRVGGACMGLGQRPLGRRLFAIALKESVASARPGLIALCFREGGHMLTGGVLDAKATSR